MAVRVCEYAVPTVPAVSVVEVMVSGAGLTTIDKPIVALAEEASVTTAVKLKVPMRVGVPEITPTELRVRPLGNVPTLDQA